MYIFIFYKCFSFWLTYHINIYIWESLGLSKQDPKCFKVDIEKMGHAHIVQKSPSVNPLLRGYFEFKQEDSSENLLWRHLAKFRVNMCH